MLTIEKYLNLFIQHFNDHSPTPLNYKTDILNHALQFRETDITPVQAADWSIQFIEDKTAFVATPEGHQFQRQIQLNQKRLHDNLTFIRTWPKHELLMLIRMHVDISEVTNDWLIQFRDDLDLMV